jgi:hypothetical protein
MCTFVPGDIDASWIEQVKVLWVKGLEFGVTFEMQTALAGSSKGFANPSFAFCVHAMSVGLDFNDGVHFGLDRYGGPVQAYHLQCACSATTAESAISAMNEGSVPKGIGPLFFWGVSS